MVDIESLAKLGRVDKEIEVNKDLKIKIHTLSASEQQSALTSVPQDSPSEFARLSHLQHAVLAQAIDEINGEKVGKDQIKKILGVLQASLVADIFTQHSLLTQEQDKILEELKKK